MWVRKSAMISQVPIAVDGQALRRGFSVRRFKALYVVFPFHAKTRKARIELTFKRFWAFVYNPRSSFVGFR